MPDARPRFPAAFPPMPWGFGALVAALLWSGPGFAHHAMDGDLPRTAAEGLLSGLAHPVIGLDHLAFVLGVGILAARVGGGAFLPLAFLLAVAVGTALHVAGGSLPGAEFGVALSVLLIGAAVLRREALPPAVAGGFFAAAGLLHGYALAESIIGAEPAPLVFYLAGLVAVQYAIGVAALFGFRALTARPKVARSAAYALGVGTVAVGAATLLGAALPLA